jgi:WS/DGAT/MGAT family acyltransferase
MKEPKRKRGTSNLVASPAPFMQEMVSHITDPFRATCGVVSATFDSVIRSRIFKKPDLVAPYSAPKSILNSSVGPQRRVSTVEFDTARLLAIGKHLGGTLNDVVMAVCGGALRAYLSELDALPAKSLVSQVPVSFRPKNDAKGGNAIGMMLASLATDEADTKQRFNKIRNSMLAGKALLADMSATQITAYSALMTFPFAVGQMTGMGNRSSRPMYNVVISNVPGPKETRYLNGAEVFSVHPVSFVMQGQALNITLFTYADKITFVFTACRESLPSVQRLIIDTTQALEDLESLLE